MSMDMTEYEQFLDFNRRMDQMQKNRGSIATPHENNNNSRPDKISTQKTNRSPQN